MVFSRGEVKRRTKEANDPLIENPKRTKVHAQRKFAQGSGLNSPLMTPIKEKEKSKPNGTPSPAELLPSKRPTTEDFLSFLCFRGTKVLPPRLDFFNEAVSAGVSSNAAAGSSKQTTNSPSGAQKIKSKNAGNKSFKKKLVERRTGLQKGNAMRARTASSERQTLLQKNKIIKQLKKKVVQKRVKAIRKTHPSILKRLGATRLRAGLRSGGTLPPGSEVGLKTDRKPKRGRPPRRQKTKKKMEEVPKKRLKREDEKVNSDKENSDDENEDEEVEAEEPEEEYQKPQKKSSISTRAKRGIPNSPVASPKKQGVSARPSRKTKEAATIYMEMLTKGYRNPDEEFEEEDDDDDVYEQSFPDLPIVAKKELEESKKLSSPKRSKQEPQMSNKGRKSKGRPPVVKVPEPDEEEDEESLFKRSQRLQMNKSLISGKDSSTFKSNVKVNKTRRQQESSPMRKNTKLRDVKPESDESEQEDEDTLKSTDSNVSPSRYSRRNVKKKDEELPSPKETKKRKSFPVNVAVEDEASEGNSDDGSDYNSSVTKKMRRNADGGTIPAKRSRIGNQRKPNKPLTSNKPYELSSTRKGTSTLTKEESVECEIEDIDTGRTRRSTSRLAKKESAQNENEELDSIPTRKGTSRSNKKDSAESDKEDHDTLPSRRRNLRLNKKELVDSENDDPEIIPTRKSTSRLTKKESVESENEDPVPTISRRNTSRPTKQDPIDSENEDLDAMPKRKRTSRITKKESVELEIEDLETSFSRRSTSRLTKKDTVESETEDLDTIRTNKSSSKLTKKEIVECEVEDIDILPSRRSTSRSTKKELVDSENEDFEISPKQKSLSRVKTMKNNSEIKEKVKKGKTGLRKVSHKEEAEDSEDEEVKSMDDEDDGFDEENEKEEKKQPKKSQGNFQKVVNKNDRLKDINEKTAKKATKLKQNKSKNKEESSDDEENSPKKASQKKTRSQTGNVDVETVTKKASNENIRKLRGSAQHSNKTNYGSDEEVDSPMLRVKSNAPTNVKNQHDKAVLPKNLREYRQRKTKEKNYEEEKDEELDVIPSNNKQNQCKVTNDDEDEDVPLINRIPTAGLGDVMSDSDDDSYKVDKCIPKTRPRKLQVARKSATPFQRKLQPEVSSDEDTDLDDDDDDGDIGVNETFKKSVVITSKKSKVETIDGANKGNNVRLNEFETSTLTIKQESLSKSNSRKEEKSTEGFTNDPKVSTLKISSEERLEKKGDCIDSSTKNNIEKGEIKMKKTKKTSRGNELILNESSTNSDEERINTKCLKETKSPKAFLVCGQEIHRNEKETVDNISGKIKNVIEDNKKLSPDTVKKKLKKKSNTTGDNQEIINDPMKPVKSKLDKSPQEIKGAEEKDLSDKKVKIKNESDIPTASFKFKEATYSEHRDDISSEGSRDIRIKGASPLEMPYNTASSLVNEKLKKEPQSENVQKTRGAPRGRLTKDYAEIGNNDELSTNGGKYTAAIKQEKDIGSDSDPCQSDLLHKKNKIASPQSSNQIESHDNELTLSKISNIENKKITKRNKCSDTIEQRTSNANSKCLTKEIDIHCIDADDHNKQPVLKKVQKKKEQHVEYKDSQEIEINCASSDQNVFLTEESKTESAQSKSKPILTEGGLYQLKDTVPKNAVKAQDHKSFGNNKEGRVENVHTKSSRKGKTPMRKSSDDVDLTVKLDENINSMLKVGTSKRSFSNSCVNVVDAFPRKSEGDKELINSCHAERALYNSPQLPSVYIKDDSSLRNTPKGNNAELINSKIDAIDSVSSTDKRKSREPDIKSPKKNEMVECSKYSEIEQKMPEEDNSAGDKIKSRRPVCLSFEFSEEKVAGSADNLNVKTKPIDRAVSDSKTGRVNTRKPSLSAHAIIKKDFDNDEIDSSIIDTYKTSGKRKSIGERGNSDIIGSGSSRLVDCKVALENIGDRASDYSSYQHSITDIPKHHKKTKPADDTNTKISANIKAETGLEYEKNKQTGYSHFSSTSSNISGVDTYDEKKDLSEKQKPNKPSINDTWRQAFRNAKIPKPGHLSPVQNSVKPFVRQKMPHLATSYPGKSSEIDTKTQESNKGKVPSGLSPFKSFMANQNQRSSSPDAKKHLSPAHKTNFSGFESPLRKNDDIKVESKKQEKSLTQLQYEKRSSELISSLDSVSVVLPGFESIRAFRKDIKRDDAKAQVKQATESRSAESIPKPSPEGKHQNLPLAVEHTLRKMSPITVSKKPPSKPITPKVDSIPAPKVVPDSPSHKTKENPPPPSVEPVASSSGVPNPSSQLVSPNIDLIAGDHSDLSFMSKKKVNMTNEEINRWLNDSTSCGIEHKKDCGIFENNQCECSYRTSGSIMQNSIGMSELVPKDDGKIDRGVVEPPVQLKELDNDGKYVAETISTCKVEDYREKLMSKTSVSETKMAPPKSRRSSGQERYKSNRSMTEEEMCEYDFRFERTSNSPRESMSDVSSVTHRDDASSSSELPERKIFHQKRSKEVGSKRPSMSSPTAFSAENESSVYAFKPDQPSITNEPFRRGRGKSGELEVEQLKESVAVQVNLTESSVPKRNSQDSESVLECSTQTERPSSHNNNVFFIPLPEQAKFEAGRPQGVTVKVDTKGPEQSFVVHAKFVTKHSGSIPQASFNSRNEKKKPEQKVRPLINARAVGKVPPTLREPETSEDGQSNSQEKGKPEKIDKPAQSTSQPSPKAAPDSPRPKSSGKAQKLAESTPPVVSKPPVAIEWKGTEFPPPDIPATLVEAPTFYPTEKEFQDPLEYIEKLTPLAQSFGICRIVPPSTFKPECKVSDDMRFTAYNQYVNRMMERWGPNVRELYAIRKYLATQSITLNQLPMIGSMEVDLPRLYQTVQQCGGLKEVIEKKRWARVADAMKIPKSAQDRVTKLDDIYCKYLLPYDTLSHDERTKLLEEADEDWKEREKRLAAEDDSVNNSGEGSDESSEADDSIFECITKGKNMPLSVFFRVARNTMATWFKDTTPTTSDVETEFWRHVQTKTCHVCVHCGSIDSGTWGYGFPTTKTSATSRHPWNLKVLTNSPGSILRSLGPVMGVTVPTLHVGMLFSSCCWYRDPHALPWIEYLHDGASKIWYGVPDSRANDLRDAMYPLLPRHIRDRKIWLPSDTMMVPPQFLLDGGVSLCRVVQEPGQFILVFPKAFTSSICTGYLVSESVYFAQPSWLNSAVQNFKDIQDSCEPPVFSLHKLLFNIANDTRSSADTLMQVLPMIESVIDNELESRKKLESLGLTSWDRLPSNKSGRRKKKEEEQGDLECDVCRGALFLSMVSNSNEDCYYCIDHAIETLDKDQSLLKYCKLLLTYDEEEMEELVDKVKNRIETKIQKKQKDKGASSGNKN